jgi:hypothetical protein
LPIEKVPDISIFVKDALYNSTCFKLGSTKENEYCIVSSESVDDDDAIEKKEVAIKNEHTIKVKPLDTLLLYLPYLYFIFTIIFSPYIILVNFYNFLFFIIIIENERTTYKIFYGGIIQTPSIKFIAFQIYEKVLSINIKEKKISPSGLKKYHRKGSQ